MGVLSGQIAASSMCLNTATFWPLIICSHQPTATGVTHAKLYLIGLKRIKSCVWKDDEQITFDGKLEHKISSIFYWLVFH